MKEKINRKKEPEVILVQDTGRIQPQAIEVEQAVLGALMLEMDAYSTIS